MPGWRRHVKPIPRPVVYTKLSARSTHYPASGELSFVILYYGANSSPTQFLPTTTHRHVFQPLQPSTTKT